jgi:SAM-dependent methyltransferase
VRVASYRFPLDPASRAEIRDLRIDSVVCLNVLEHIDDDRGALADMYDVLQPDGRLVLLVPAFARLYGTLDVHLRHFRRYEREELESKLREAGFAIEDLRFANRPGILGWWVNGKLLRRRVLPRSQLLAFKLLMPMLEREKERPPTAGLSLVAIARKSDAGAKAPASS